MTTEEEGHLTTPETAQHKGHPTTPETTEDQGNPTAPGRRADDSLGVLWSFSSLNRYKHNKQKTAPCKGNQHYVVRLVQAQN